MVTWPSLPAAASPMPTTRQARKAVATDKQLRKQRLWLPPFAQAVRLRKLPTRSA